MADSKHEQVVLARPAVTKTFVRKPKAKEVDLELSSVPASSPTAELTLLPESSPAGSSHKSTGSFWSPVSKENEATADTPKALVAPRPWAQHYSRRVPPKQAQQEEAARVQYFAHIRAHFAEVDEFELVEESPEPLGARRQSTGADLGRLPSPNAATLLPRPSPTTLSQPATPAISKASPTPASVQRRTAAWVPLAGLAPSPLGKPPADPAAGTPGGAEAGKQLTVVVEGKECSSSSSKAGRPSAAVLPQEGGLMLQAAKRTRVQASEDAARTGAGAATEIADLLRGNGAPREDEEEQQAPAQRLSAAPMRAPSLGLSRRSSTCVVGQARGRRSSLAPLAAAGRISLADGQPPGRQDSTALQVQQYRGSSIGKGNARLGRLSSRVSLGEGFSRLSAGLSESLQRLSLFGAAPPPVKRETNIAVEMGRRSTFLHPGAAGFSPIAESAEAEPDAVGTPVPAGDTLEGDAEHISRDLERQLRISDAAAASPTEDLTPLQELLRICNQSTDEAVLPSMEELLGEHVDLGQVRKIGEGTFGEAFRGGSAVFKIVPMDGALKVNGEPQKRSEEILSEASIQLTLSQLRGPSGEGSDANMTAGFVEMYGVGVCRGRYAPALRREWHAWDALYNSENDAVDAFPATQTFVVFVVADGGVDLERFEVRGFGEAVSMLLQCTLTLAVAEEACEFEHRDLHWGNILLRRDSLATAAFRLRGVDVAVECGGLAVTLIDFTLSRLRTAAGDVAFCDLAADPELFAGPKGDCQADTYRRMRKATKGNWQGHTPRTNVLWLHYLTDVLLTQKRFPCNPEQKRALRAFRKRVLEYSSCNEAVWDEFFVGLWRTTKPQRS